MLCRVFACLCRLSPSYDCFMTSWGILDSLECITFSARGTYLIRVKKQKTLSKNAVLVCDSNRDFLTPHRNVLRRLGRGNVCRSPSRGLSVVRNLIFSSLWMNTVDFPCSSTSSATVMDSLNNLFCLFGFPPYLHSDRGASFMSRDLKAFLAERGIASSRSSPYYPTGNSQCESKPNRLENN